MLRAFRLLAREKTRDPGGRSVLLLEPGADPATRAATRNRIKSQLAKLEARIARLRGGDRLDTHDEVGRYLVDVTGTLGKDDLEWDDLEDRNDDDV